MSIKHVGSAIIDMRSFRCLSLHFYLSLNTLELLNEVFMSELDPIPAARVISQETADFYVPEEINATLTASPAELASHVLGRALVHGRGLPERALQDFRPDGLLRPMAELARLDLPSAGFSQIRNFVAAAALNPNRAARIDVAAGLQPIFDREQAIPLGDHLSIRIEVGNYFDTAQAMADTNQALLSQHAVQIPAAA